MTKQAEKMLNPSALPLRRLSDNELRQVAGGAEADPLDYPGCSVVRGPDGEVLGWVCETDLDMD